MAQELQKLYKVEREREFEALFRTSPLRKRVEGKTPGPALAPGARPRVDADGHALGRRIGVRRLHEVSDGPSLAQSRRVGG